MGRPNTFVMYWANVLTRFSLSAELAKMPLILPAEPPISPTSVSRGICSMVIVWSEPFTRTYRIISVWPMGSRLTASSVL